MPPLNKVLLLPIPPSLPGSLFQETRVYKSIQSPPPPCTIVWCFISLFYNLLVGVKNIPNCRQIESSCGECIQNIDPPCSWCEDTVSTLCFLVGLFISFLIRGNFLIPIICSLSQLSLFLCKLFILVLQLLTKESCFSF